MKAVLYKTGGVENLYLGIIIQACIPSTATIKARFNDEAQWLFYNHLEKITERSKKKNSWLCIQDIVGIGGGQLTNFSNEVCLHSLCVALCFKL